MRNKQKASPPEDEEAEKEAKAEAEILG